MNTVAFTGYRPEKMPFSEDEEDESYIRFREQQHKVINRLIERGYTEYLSGVAMGFDTWVAEDILEFRMVAGINKFLRIYYGKVTELYRELEA